MPQAPAPTRNAPQFFASPRSLRTTSNTMKDSTTTSTMDAASGCNVTFIWRSLVPSEARPVFSHCPTLANGDAYRNSLLC